MAEGFQRIICISVILSAFFCIESYSQNAVLDNFKNINNQAQVIPFHNNLEINNRGGHVQGVQYIKSKGNEYVYLSGSSDLHAYYALVKLGTEGKVISVNNLMKKPFKHSGGIQIFQEYLVVGIEDNSKKDISKVCIYDISNPEKTDNKPVSVIQRKGEPLRSTAGCVGLTKYKNKALIAVGDWDTRHLDFYTCDFEKLGSIDFKKVGTIDTKNISRKGWIDKNWESYQNINLFVFNDNELYLIGLGQNKKGEDIADLFRIKETASNNFELKKLATKTFNCKKESSFKAGAGIYVNEQGKFHIYSCSYHIKGISYLNYFDTAEKM